MKVGLYSITYAGMWYDGPPLSIRQTITKAKQLGFQGVELDCRPPHAVPYLLSERDRKEIVQHLAKEGIELSALAANNDFSSPVIEHRDAQIQMVVDMIHLCRDLGAPILRVFTAWAGTTRRDGLGVYEIADRAYERAFPDTTQTERWQFCLECFRVVAKVAEDLGVTLALQNHPPVVRNHMDVLDMIGQVGSPSLKVSFDISGERAWQETEWVLAAARRLGGLWVHSHLSSAFARKPDGTVVRVPLGRVMHPTANMYNAEAWIQAMSEAGYKGYVNYEGCTPIYAPTGRYAPIEYVDEQVVLARDYMIQQFAKYQKGRK